MRFLRINFGNVRSASEALDRSTESSADTVGSPTTVAVRDLFASRRPPPSAPIDVPAARALAVAPIAAANRRLAPVTESLRTPVPDLMFFSDEDINLSSTTPTQEHGSDDDTCSSSPSSVESPAMPSPTAGSSVMSINRLYDKKVHADSIALALRRDKYRTSARLSRAETKVAALKDDLSVAQAHASLRGDLMPLIVQLDVARRVRNACFESAKEAMSAHQEAWLEQAAAQHAYAAAASEQPWVAQQAAHCRTDTRALKAAGNKKTVRWADENRASLTQVREIPSRYSPS